MEKMKHLSVVDGAFLHLETPEMPMHVGSLNIFEPFNGVFIIVVKQFGVYVRVGAFD